MSRQGVYMYMRPRIGLVLLGAVLLTSCGSLDREDSEGSTDRPAGSVSPVSQDTASPQCEFPSTRPAYLPWLPADETVPHPLRDTLEGEARLIWRAGSPGWEGAYVILRVFTADSIGRTESVPVVYGGTEGFVSIGEGAEDEDVADVGIVWVNGDGDCNTMALVLFAPALSLEQGKVEVEKIAESLSGTS